MEDHQHFTLVRTAGELYAIASEFKNCASIYIPSSIQGYYVHWSYRNHGESELLQLDFRNLARPSLKQHNFEGSDSFISDQMILRCERVKVRDKVFDL